MSTTEAMASDTSSREAMEMEATTLTEAMTTNSAREVSNQINVQAADNSSDVQMFHHPSRSGDTTSNNYFYLNNSSVNFAGDNRERSHQSSSPYENIVGSTKLLLDVLDWSDFVKTRAYNEARNRVKNLKICIILSRQGTGKTTIGKYVIKSLSRKGQPVILTDPSEWDLIPQHPRKIVNVLIDDMFGFDNINPVLKDRWLHKFDLIYNRAMYGRVCVLILLRTDMFNQCKEQLSGFKLFSHAHIISLTDPKYKLTNKEMLEIAKCCFRTRRLQAEVNETQLELHSLASISFPQICAFYASNPTAQQRGLQKYLENPVECITEELKLLQEQNSLKYFILVLVMIMRGCLPRAFFYDTTDTKEKLCILRKVRKFIPFTVDETVTNLEATANSIVGVFLSFSLKENSYRFIHSVICDALLLSLNNFDIKDIIDVCPVSFLSWYTTIPRWSLAETALTVRVIQQEFIHLARRMAFELTKGDYLAILDHAALRDNAFVKCLTERILKISGCKKIRKRNVGFFTIHKKACYCFANETWVFSVPDNSSDPCAFQVTKWMCSCGDLLCLIVIKNLQYLALMVTNQIDHYFNKRLLYCACYMGFYPLVKLLLQNSPTEISASTVRQILTASIASEKESVTLIRYLLKVFRNAHKPFSEKIYFRFVQDLARLSLVHLKCKHLKIFLQNLRKRENYFDVVRKLCHQLLVQFRQVQGYSHLQESQCSRQYIVTKMLELLLKACKPKFPGKMIYLAAMHVKPGPLNLLLQSCPYIEYVTGQNIELWNKDISGSSTNICAICEKGRTALLEASCRSLDSVKLLLKHNANVFASDENGYTLLHSGMIYSDPCLLEDILIRRLFIVSDLFDNAGVTPLHVASEHANFICFQLLLECYTDINKQTHAGTTVLHEALLSKNDKCPKVEALLEKGADIHVADRQGNTPLHLAAVGNHTNIVLKLINLGANINQKNNEGNTALHVAFSLQSTKESVKTLLQEGADVLIANNCGVTPLYQAVNSTSVDIVILCLKYCPQNSASFSDLNPHPLVALPNIEKIKLLLKHGFCKTAKNAQDCLIALARDTFPKPKGVNAPFDKEIHESENIFPDQEDTLDRDCFEEILNLMCEKGACVNKPSPGRYTPLQMAMNSSNAAIVDALLQKGANPNLVTFQREIETDDDELISCLIDDLIDEGRFPRVYAIWQLLMDKGWQPDIGTNGNSILPAIAYRRYWRTLELLLKHGYDVNAKSNYGTSSLHECLTSWRCLKVLLDYNVNVNSQDRDGKTALHLMIMKSESSDKLALLLQKGANPNMYDQTGNTPLLAACKQCQISGKSKNQRNKKKMIKQIVDGTTVTTYEVKEKVKKFRERFGKIYDNVKVLLANGADGGMKDTEGYAAPHVAVNQSNFELLDVLLQGGCSVDVTDLHGNTPLNLFLRTKIKAQIDANVEPQDADIISSLETPVCIGKDKEWTIVKYLLEKKADPNVKNEYGETPLHYAAVTDCHRTVELLLDADADVDAEDEKNRTPLHRLAHCGHTRIARVLLDNGGDVDVTDSNGNTALHIAVRKRKYNLVKLLVKKGTDLTIKNENAETAQDVCQHLEHSNKQCWWIHKGNTLLEMLDPTRI